MFVSCFYFFYFYVFIYLFIFYFLFQKDSSFFNMFYNGKKKFNCIFVWLDAGPPVFPKDFFNRNGTSRGPPQWLPCHALPCPVWHQLHRERAVTGRIFQALPNFCPHRQTPCLLLYIWLNDVTNMMLTNQSQNAHFVCTEWAQIRCQTRWKSNRQEGNELGQPHHMISNAHPWQYQNYFNGTCNSHWIFPPLCSSGKRQAPGVGIKIC
jgi:hypothetical protein